jgi:serine/threonine protein kinase
MSFHAEEDAPILQVGIVAAQLANGDSPVDGTVVCDPHTAALGLLAPKLTRVVQLLTVHGQSLLLIGTVASGMWSDVYAAQDTSTGESCALKIVPKVSVAALREECARLRGLTHVNVVRLYGEFPLTINGASFHCVKMEFCSKGTLRQLIKQRQVKGKPLPASSIRHFVGQLADALTYVHRSGVLHGDVRSENVLLTAGDAIKLSGFASSSRLLRNRAPGLQLTITGGSRTYAPPEWQDSVQLQRALQPLETLLPSYDMWGLGLVLSEMVTLQLVFGGRLIHFRALASDPAALAVLKEDTAVAHHGQFLSLCAGLLTWDPAHRTEAVELAHAVPESASGGWRASMFRWAHCKPALAQTA